MSAKVVSMFNLKGGVGKSTLAMMLGEYAAHVLNRRVLLIDFDSQANLTSAMVRPLHVRGDLERERRTVFHLFQDSLDGKRPSIEDYICTREDWVSNVDPRPGVDLHMVIATPELAGLDEVILERSQDPHELLATLHRLYTVNPEGFREAAPEFEDAISGYDRSDGTGMPSIENIREILLASIESAKSSYDVVIIDAPPGLSLFTSAAIVASDYYVSPVIPEPLSIMGIDMIRSRVNTLRRQMKLEIQFAGTILNKVMAHRRGHAITASRLYGIESAGLAPFPTDYRPFQYYIPDAERFRQVSQYEAELLPGGGSARFGGVHDKYGASVVEATNPSTGSLKRSEDGSKYYVSHRCRRVTEEFLERIGA